MTISPHLDLSVRPAARAFGSYLGPSRRAKFDHRHIPQQLPDAWFDRHFGHLPPGNRKYLKRLAAIRLVRMIEGGSYGHAGRLLGLTEATTKATLVSLSQWLQNTVNADMFTAALNALADELDTITKLTDYGNRRRALADWLIPSDDWHDLTRMRREAPRPRGGMIDWGDYKRRFASWIAWVEITSGEHLFAPTTILPAHARGSQNQLRSKLTHEWSCFHKRPMQYHAELAQLVHDYTKGKLHEIDTRRD